MLGTQSGFGLFEPGKYAPMGRMDRGRSMDQILRETCGTKYAEEFWKRWRRLYLTEEDIALLSRRGYNSVRLPIRAGSFLYEEPGITYNEDSFAMLNDVLDWCETYQVYAVVDSMRQRQASPEFRVMTAWTMDSICMTMKNRWSGCFF